jgi:hypothetical protein
MNHTGQDTRNHSVPRYYSLCDKISDGSTSYDGHDDEWFIGVMAETVGLTQHNYERQMGKERAPEVLSRFSVSPMTIIRRKSLTGSFDHCRCMICLYRHRTAPQFHPRFDVRWLLVSARFLQQLCRYDDAAIGHLWHGRLTHNGTVLETCILLLSPLSLIAKHLSTKIESAACPTRSHSSGGSCHMVLHLRTPKIYLDQAILKSSRSRSRRPWRQSRGLVCLTAIEISLQYLGWTWKQGLISEVHLLPFG